MLLVSLKQVFTKPKYVVLAIIVSVLVFLLSTWLPNFRLIGQVFSSQYASALDKLNILFVLATSISTNFTAFSAFYTVTIDVLFGLNIALVVYYISRRRKVMENNGMATSFAGFISGMFGIGCAACGTFVLGPLLGAIGGAGLIALLPFGGEEFGVIGAGILAYSVYLTSKKIQEPEVCKIPTK